MLYIIRCYTYSLLMVQNMLLKTYLSYSTWYTILGMHINASDRHSQLHRIQEFLSNPSLPHENYHVFTRIHIRTPFHFCSRPSWHLLKIRYTTVNDALHLLDMRKNNEKHPWHSMTTSWPAMLIATECDDVVVPRSFLAKLPHWRSFSHQYCSMRS